MDLLRFGNRGKLLEVKTQEFILSFYGVLSNTKAINLKVNKNIPAAILVDGYSTREIIVKTLTDFGDLVENSGITMKPCFFEDGQYQVVLEIKEPGKYDIYHAEAKISNNFDIIGNIYLGIIDFSSDIGYTNIDIMKNNKKILTVTLEVFPSKLDYFKDYQDIITEINEEVASLAFKFLDNTYLKSKFKDVSHQTNTEYINILEYIFDDLIKSLERIESRFRHNVINDSRITKIYKAKRISKANRSYLRSHPDLLVKSEKGFINIGGKNYSALKVIEEKKTTTNDTYENRFVKYILQRIIRRLAIIEKYLDKKLTREHSYLEMIEEKRKILNNHLKRHFKDISNLTGKKSMSLVFQMALGYKDLYIKYSLLSKGLDLGDDLIKITPKKLYSLYEMWCYIKIHKILSELGYEVEEYGILKYKDNGMYLLLDQGSEAKMVYKNNKNRLELWYNKSYSSPTTDQRPDTVLYIKKIDSNDDRIYIFDAKYRLCTDNNGVVGPMVDDINVMHRYRDSIVSHMGTGFKYKYETFGAYVMFPYGDEKKFIEHKFYKSIDEVNIGAFPMLPGSTKLIQEHLESIINQSHIEAKNRRIAIDEYDDYARFKLENVMVVNVKDRNHLEIYIKKLFYHIPIKSLSDIRLGVEYIAFYQSRRSFGDQAGIRYYAKINEIVKYERNNCIEISSRPGTENDLYLRLNLDEIKNVGTVMPIQSGTQLVSYTTLYLLKNAENMHELKLKSNLEIEVYKRLKRIGKDNKWIIRKEFNTYIINKNIIEIIEDKEIIVNGKIVNLRNIENNLF